MTDISLLPQNGFDVLGALELYLLITDADVTKRCMSHCLAVMQEKMKLTESEENRQFEEFLADVAKVLEAGKGLKMEGSKQADRTELIPRIDITRFKSTTISAWTMANTICECLREWPKTMELEETKVTEKIDEDRIRRICWEYYFKEMSVVVTKKEWLSPECTYRLFLIYHKLLLQDATTDLEVGQVNAFLMKMVSISQYTWNPSLEYKAEGSDYVTFPEFVTVVTEYFHSLHLTTDFTCELIFELYELMIKGILKKGFLVKKGHVRKNWKRRYFVLQMTTLTYYEDKTQTEWKGELVMNRHTKLLDVRDADTHTHPNKFFVTCGESGKEFEICAEDKKTKQSWILAIQKALSVTKMKSPSNTEEFVTSLSHWRQSVYGENPSSSTGSDPRSLTSPLRALGTLDELVTEMDTHSQVEETDDKDGVSSTREHVEQPSDNLDEFHDNSLQEAEDSQSDTTLREPRGKTPHSSPDPNTNESSGDNHLMDDHEIHHDVNGSPSQTLPPSEDCGSQFRSRVRTIDVSLLPQSEFDATGALQLHLSVTDADVTKRCMSHSLTVMQDEIRLTESEENRQLDEFLADILKVLEGGKGSRTKGSKKVDRTSLVTDENVEGFYSRLDSPWVMASTICDAVKEWPRRMGLEKEKRSPKKIDEDRVRRICWEYYLKEKKGVVTKKEWLSPECTYRLFLIYNKLLLRDDTTDLEVGQVNAFLMKMVSISQYTWNPSLEYKAEGSDYVTFPEFVTVVTEYFHSLHLTTDFTCELIFELYELMIKGILKKGYLEKKGHIIKNWKRRYFVLQMTTLTYYEDKTQTERKGELMMNRDTMLLDVRDADTHTHPNKFFVTCGESGKEFEICAEDKKTKQSWILAIQKALSLTKIKSPSDRVEFVTSLTQWRQSVYGNSMSPLEWIEPLSETVLIQEQMTSQVVRNLVENRISASSSLPPNTPTSPANMPQYEVFYDEMAKNTTKEVHSGEVMLCDKGDSDSKEQLVVNGNTTPPSPRESVGEFVTRT